MESPLAVTARAAQVGMPFVLVLLVMEVWEQCQLRTTSAFNEIISVSHCVGQHAHVPSENLNAPVEFRIE